MVEPKLALFKVKIESGFVHTSEFNRHMYMPGDALYPDYPGGFYYRFGDHVYHDGSRCEGLMAAYRLAC